MLNVTKKGAYIILAISIIFEIIGDSVLQASDGYKHLGVGILALLIIVFSFFLFSKVLHIINIAVAYATWSSVGAIAVAIIGFFAFGQELTLVGWISLFVLAAGTFVMNMWGTPEEKGEEEE